MRIHTIKYNISILKTTISIDLEIIFLTSLIVTGLQDLINSAKSFIVSHGLNFNPSKTVCTTFGHTVFERTPAGQ